MAFEGIWNVEPLTVVNGSDDEAVYTGIDQLPALMLASRLRMAWLRESLSEANCAPVPTGVLNGELIENGHNAGSRGVCCDVAGADDPLPLAAGAAVVVVALAVVVVVRGLAVVVVDVVVGVDVDVDVDVVEAIL